MLKNYKITVNGKSYDVTVEDQISTATASEMFAAPVIKNAVDSSNTTAQKKVKENISGAVEAPMPGKVLRLFVAEGDKVVEGQELLLLEAMKMENEIFAPKAGVVQKIIVSAGDNVNTKDALLVIA